MHPSKIEVWTIDNARSVLLFCRSTNKAVYHFRLFLVTRGYYRRLLQVYIGYFRLNRLLQVKQVTTGCYRLYLVLLMYCWKSLVWLNTTRHAEAEEVYSVISSSMNCSLLFCVIRQCLIESNYE